MSVSHIQPGFEDPVFQSQQVFRQVLNAMSRPGRVHELDGLSPAAPGLSPAATAVCLTLLDFETPLWLDEAAAAAGAFFVFHCSVPLASSQSDAAIAVVGDAQSLGSLDQFCLGSDEHPELSTTLIIEVGDLEQGSGTSLAGPGINNRTALHVDGVSRGFWSQVAANHALFPRGIDLLLTAGHSVAALPRSVRVDGEG